MRGRCFLWDPKALFKETTVKCAVGIDEALMKVIQHVWEGLVEWLIKAGYDFFVISVVRAVKVEQ